MTLREKIGARDNDLSHEDCERLLLALDTLEAMEFVVKRGGDISFSARTRTPGYQPWIVVADDRSAGADSFPAAVQSLRESLAKGERT